MSRFNKDDFFRDETKALIPTPEDEAIDEAREHGNSVGSAALVALVVAAIMSIYRVEVYDFAMYLRSLFS